LYTEQKGRHTEIKIGNLPVCLADPILLQQVFINLIGNSLKFTRIRELALIEVGCQARDPEGELVFFVKDNGACCANPIRGLSQRRHRFCQPVKSSGSPGEETSARVIGTLQRARYPF
jgi:light-regulated signal transduction histidine kinase (bacteriophytochrome)